MINNVSFGSTAGVFTKPDFSKPQANTRTNPVLPGPNPPVPPENKKGGKFKKFVVGLAVTAAAVAGLLVAGNKTGVLKNIGKYIPDSIKNAGWLQTAKNPVKNAVAGMDKAGGAIAEYAVKGYEAVKGFGKTALDTVKGWFGKAPTA